jgi:flagella basal body P-ring formation protein FlgA
VALGAGPGRALGEVKALSERDSADISGNSAAFAGLFAPCRGEVRSYSAAMLSIALLAPLARVAPRRLAWCALVVCGLVAAALPANADEPAAALPADLAEQVRELAHDKAASGGAARIEVTVGQLDPRLRLAPCERIEPYLPANVRLWGKTRIGLRCKEGRTAWNVYLPIVVKVWGRALVVPAGAAAGAVLAERDLAEAEVDLAEEFTAAVVDPRLVVGRTLAQALRPGQAVRQAHIKSRQWFAAGETVKVVAVGNGFALEGVGQAITNGIEGQPARVRTETGQVVTGSPVGERRLELAL